MKKGQIYEGVIERVDFPNKGLVHVLEEHRYVTVKNGIPGQKVRFVINKAPGSAGEVPAGDERTGVQHLPGVRRMHVPDHALRRADEDVPDHAL